MMLEKVNELIKEIEVSENNILTNRCKDLMLDMAITIDEMNSRINMLLEDRG